jgi:hypothetical protein
MLGGMKASASRMSAAKWSELVAGWEASGRSLASFAAEHGVSESSLRWWKTELARRARNEAAQRSPGPRHARSVALARVVREGEGATRSVAIDVEGARIVVETGFDHQLLREVLGVLGGNR